MAVVLSADAVWAQDFVRYDQQAARSWTLHRIAVIQADRGDVVGAKNTVAEITEPQWQPGAFGGDERMVLQRHGDVRSSAGVCPPPL